MSAIRTLVGLFMLIGCADPAPRFGEVTLSAAAPRLVLSGTTFGDATALELAPGCPGYLDAEIPGHLLHVSDEVPFRVQARSDVGPLALAIARGDEVQCDSDSGTGHTPSLTFREAGDYTVFVAALREPAALPYEITVTVVSAEVTPTETSEPVASGPTRDVTVTMTSEPSGAEVRDAGGAMLGVTPAMFVVSVPESELGQSRTWTLSHAGFEPVEVSGSLREGALVLHGQLTVSGPVEIRRVLDQSQPLRDMSSANLSTDVNESCSIREGEIEVAIDHPLSTDLRVVLVPPSGGPIELARHDREAWPRTFRTADAPLSSLIGRNTRGRWTLSVHDDASGDEGRLQRFSLSLSCGEALLATSDLPVPGEALDPWATPPRPTPQRPIAPVVPRPPTPPRPPALPDLPNRTDIVRVLGGLRPNVENCGATGGSARVLATVAGRNGRVTEISSSGSASDAERQCVERIVRGATFPRFRRTDLDVDYTYDLPARPQATQL